ncbi:MAG: hypothetical protein WC876_01570 [Candidatus Thermoplasmatota archaeon]|jgi:hypothetical protein
MDASKQATRKDEKREHSKDDLRADHAKGRYEGGRDADQNRQANQDRHKGRADEPKAERPAAPEVPAEGKDRRGMEAEA